MPRRSLFRRDVARSSISNESVKNFEILGHLWAWIPRYKREAFSRKKGGIWRPTEGKDRRIERDWRRWILRYHEDDFFCISFPDPFDVENLSVCNENHYELTFLSLVLSKLTAPLWINTLIVVYLILV